MYINGDNRRASYDAIYFNSFRAEHIEKEIKKFIGNKNIITNIYKIQAYDSIMGGYFCIRFFGFMVRGKHLLDYTNLFSPNDYENNDKIFSVTKRMKKLYCVISSKYRKFEKPKIPCIFEKTLVLSTIFNKSR